MPVPALAFPFTVRVRLDKLTQWLQDSASSPRERDHFVPLSLVAIEGDRVCYVTSTYRSNLPEMLLLYCCALDNWNPGSDGLVLSDADPGAGDRS